VKPDRRILRRALLAVAILAGTTGLMPATAHEDPAVRRPCDALDAALCLLPFPNDYFTKADPATATGRRIDFLPVEMPRSLAGKPIDPTEWNRNDGFSPGSMVLTFVPGLDLWQTWGTATLGGRDPSDHSSPNDPRDHLADIERYADADAPMLIVDETSGKRWPFWSELDMNASTPADGRLLILRPAVNFTEGHTYIVALRNLKDAGGSTIPASPQFAAYRDGAPAPDLTFDESRREHIQELIAVLQNAEGTSFDASELYLTWDFTVASVANLTERALHIRDDAFAKLGDANLADRIVTGAAPDYSITSAAEVTNDTTKYRQVEGTIRVPNYLTTPPQPEGVEAIPIPQNENTEDYTDYLPVDELPVQVIPGGRFVYGLDGLPMQNPVQSTIDVPFSCTIPAGATTSPAHPTLYGHGLLGSRSESSGSSTTRDRAENFMPCAVNWMGMAEYDFVNAINTLADPSNMPSIIDRAQQGFLNFLYLGRALIHEDGLAQDPAFRLNGEPLFHSGELFYDGNSQGGIMGGALTALAPDFTRATLGVPGMNYSTLLNRSVDWEGPLFDPDDPDIPSYSSVLYTMFPNKQEQQLVMALIQMIWDRGEGNGYAAHMTTDPLKNTPAHQVLMHVALGDFQVTNFAAEVEARTIGARVLQTALAPGRHWSVDPLYGMVPFDVSGSAIVPWAGSAIVYWDAGNLLPPNANVPPLEVPPGDPHSKPRKNVNAAHQKTQFYLTGFIEDVMNGGPYLV
jgi:hypothetical protein